METKITGKAYVVGDNVDTDQIIPAEFLSYNPADAEERKQFGHYALSGVPAAQAGRPDGNQPFVVGDAFASEYAIIIAGKNFGCGSSREHAPLAIAEAGCRLVIAESFARIFFRNSVNGGYLAPIETPDPIFEKTRTGDEVTIDLDAGTLINARTGETLPLSPLGDVAEIVADGGLFAHARKTGQISK